ncbi:amidohydrolase family protein [Schumannella luteola]
MSAVTIRARHVLSADASEFLSDAAVVIRGGRVFSVGPWRDVEPAGTLVEVDGVLTPGFVDAHSHLRGLPLPEQGIPPRQFESWICSLGAAAALDPADEALLATTELLQTGVTAVQGFVDAAASGDVLAGARRALSGASGSGIRALVVLGFADRALRTPEPATGEWALVPPSGPHLPVERIAEVAADWLATETPETVALGIGPVGGQWSTDALLEAIAAAAGDTRLHTHLHESRLHRGWLEGQPSPLDRLDAAGLLDARLSGAHAVHLTAPELDRIAAAGSSLVHCPVSNDALLVGTAHVSAWLERGIPAALGVDSQNTGAPDYFDVMRAAIAQSATVGTAISPAEVFAMATVGGSRALGIPGGGSIAPGAHADLLELDLEPSIEAIVESGSAAAVSRVWVAGSPVVEGGRSLVDPEPARARLRAQLAADRPDRERRLAELAPAVDLVERLAGARA